MRLHRLPIGLVLQGVVSTETLKRTVVITLCCGAGQFGIGLTLCLRPYAVLRTLSVVVSDLVVPCHGDIHIIVEDGRVGGFVLLKQLRRNCGQNLLEFKALDDGSGRSKGDDRRQRHLGSPQRALSPYGRSVFLDISNMNIRQQALGMLHIGSNEVENHLVLQLVDWKIHKVVRNLIVDITNRNRKGI